MLIAMLLTIAPLHDMATLAAQIGSFAGSAPVLDPRLQLAACPAPEIGWAGPTRAAVSVQCDTPAWRIYVPLASRPAVVPLVRRGDAVMVAVGGSGFSVTVDGVAEADAAAGDRLRVKLASGRLIAIVGDDGNLTLPGYSSPRAGR